MELRRVSCRCNIVDFAVSPDAVVEHLNVLKDDEFYFFTGCKSVMLQTLRLDLAKETLHRRIVPTIAASTHRSHHAITVLQGSVSGVCGLN